MFGVINIVGTKSRIAVLIKECILNQTLSKTFIRSLATFFFISISITNKKGHKHHNSLLLIQLFSFQAISVLYLAKQRSVAAKPKQGVIGFLVGGLCWFAIPFGLATTTSLAYIALSANQNQALLSDTDVDAG